MNKDDVHSHGIKMFAGTLCIMLIALVALICVSKKYELTSRMERAKELESYGNYLGAYDLYMEIYGEVGDWKGVYGYAEDARQKYEEQLIQTTMEHGVF